MDWTNLAVAFIAGGLTQAVLAYIQNFGIKKRLNKIEKKIFKDVESR